MNTDTNDSSFSSLLRQIINLVAIVAAFGINVFANLNPPNGLTIGDISNQLFDDILITPANYAFAIWGIIYLGLISFAIYQVLPAQRNSLLLQKLGYKIAIASGAQIIWVFAFLYQQFFLSLLLMLVILGALIAGYLVINSPIKSLAQKWFITIPINLYLAWISVATVVNVATALSYYDWRGWGLTPQVWTIVMLVIVSIIGAIMALQKNVPFVGVYIWALVAISVKNQNNYAIKTTASIAIFILTIILSFRVLYDAYNKLKIKFDSMKQSYSKKNK